MALGVMNLKYKDENLELKSLEPTQKTPMLIFITFLLLIVIVFLLLSLHLLLLRIGT